MGEFMKYLPITLIIVLSSSLFVALVINPVLTVLFMKVREDDISFGKAAKKGLYITILVALIVGFMPGITQNNIEYQMGDYGGLLSFLHRLSQVIVSCALLFMMSRLLFISGETDKKQVLIPSLIFIAISGLFYLSGQNVNANFVLITSIFLILNAYVIYPASIRFSQGFMPKLEALYNQFIRFALRGKNAYRFLFGTFLLLIFSVILLGLFTPAVLFFPNNQPKYLNVFIETPIGTDIYETDKVTKVLEKRVLVAIQKYEAENPKTGKMENYLVNSVIAQVGEGTSDPAQGFSAGTTPNKAMITISFVDYKERRGVNTSDVMSEIREATSGIPGVKLSVDKDASGPPSGAPINIEVAGDDYEELIQEATNIRTFINNANITGIEELKLDVDQGRPEMPITIDRDKTRRLGISTGQIASSTYLIVWKGSLYV